MQKCNLFYRLKNKLNAESGVTLIELLAVLSILSVFILLAGSIHIFGQKQFTSQTQSASQANDFSYALTDMTTELRKYKPGDVSVEGNIIKVNNGIEYKQLGTELVRNNSVIASSVGSFTATKYTDRIEIKIEATNQTAADKDYHTTIYFRGE